MVCAEKTYDHKLNALPSKVIPDDHYYIKQLDGTVKHYIGDANGNPLLVTGDPIVTPASGEMIFSEVLTGLVNGLNATFTTNVAFIPDKINVYINGLKQEKDFYTQFGGNTIILDDVPSIGDLISADYIKL